MACLPLLPPLLLPSQSNLSVFPPFTDGPQKRALQSLGVVSVGVEGGDARSLLLLLFFGFLALPQVYLR